MALLCKGMFGLKGYMKVLDASRPWLVYWMLHSLSLLNGLHTKDSTSDNELFHRVVSTLSRMARKETNVGGYGGGPSLFCCPGREGGRRNATPSFPLVL